MTKSRKLFAIGAAVIVFAAGCGTEKNTAEEGGKQKAGQASFADTEQNELVEGTESSLEQELEEMFLAAEEDSMGSSLDVVYAEEAEYPQLAEFLIAYYQVPEEEQARTRYYYNYIDLNEDGTDEIFAVVIGDYTEGKSGGAPAVILNVDGDGHFTVLEAFAEINTPVMISTNVTNGWRDIILDRYGLHDGDGYLICQYQPEGGYQTEYNELVEELEPIPCTQILSNNLIDDMDQGRYLTLATEQAE